MGCKIGGQRMKLPSGNIHLLRFRGGIQNGKLLIQLLGMAGLNASLRAGQKELFDPFMPEAANHSEILYCVTQRCTE
jgi:hypothetical protein